MPAKWRNKLSGFTERGGKQLLGIEMPRQRASELIRTAEKFIGEHRYDIAAEQLTRAQRIDPSNPYIPAILARVQRLQTGTRDALHSGERGFFEPTVGAEHADGVRPPEQSAASVDRWIASADAYLRRGALDNAFESLMNAYMLDPLNPTVVACEERVLPAWEKARAEGKSSFAHLAPISIRETSSVLSAAGTAAPSGLPQPMLNQLSEDARLAILHQQKEAERLRREQAMWREASRPRES